jgi:hypothetical protein
MNTLKKDALFSALLHIGEFLVCAAAAIGIAYFLPEIRNAIGIFILTVILDFVAKFLRADQSNNLPDYVNVVNPTPTDQAIATHADQANE